MSDWKPNSPLLTGMQMLSCLSDAGGIAVYEVKSVVDENAYIFKTISVPESQRHIEGLRYSGAIKTAGEAQEYYAQIAADYKKELELLKEAAQSGAVACYPAWHIAPKENEVGFDIQLLTKKRVTLTEYLQNTPITQLKAANLALDLSRSLMRLREIGLVHCDIKPSNVYLDETGHFIIGDLGLLQISNLKYAAVQERFLGNFAAPELFDMMQCPNETVDIYSLGLLLYSIYNGGHNPFEDEETSAKGASDKRISGAELPAPLFADYEIAAIILKACAFAPAERYQSPKELNEELQAYAQRNELTETLIVPPIVADDDLLLTEDAMNEEVVPMHFAKAEELEDDFVHHFSPDAEVLNESIEAVQAESGEESVSREAEVVEDTAEQGEPIADNEAESASSADAEFTEDIPGPAKKEKKPSKGGLIAAIAAAAAAVLVGAYFLLVPGVRDFEIVSSSTDSISVVLDSVYRAGAFSATCTDSYGNRFTGTVEGEQIKFSSLHPGTQYTVRLKSSMGLSVRGKDTFSVSTAQATNVLSFVAKPLSESEVELSFTIEGRDQESWNLEYGSSEENKKTVSFTGHMLKITDLQPNSNYTFTLLNSESISLSGNTQVQYDTTVQVDVFDTKVQYTETEAILTWNFEGRAPQSWSVVYTDTAGQKFENSVKEPAITLSELAPETDYSIEIFCSGMSSAISVPVRREVPEVKTSSATANEDGTVSVTWTTEEQLPDGWLVTARLKNGSVAASAADGGAFAVMLDGLVPDTDYEIHIKPANGWSASGPCVLTVHTAKVPNFNKYGLTDAYLGLFKHSGKEVWGVGDLLVPRSAYSAGESIAFALKPLKRIQKSEQIITATTVLRNPAGEIIYQTSAKYKWNDLWDQNLFLGEVTGVELTSGTYSVEVYFNNALVVKRNAPVN